MQRNGMQMYGTQSIDELGGVVLPKELRRRLRGFGAKDIVLYTIGKIVIMQPMERHEEQQPMGGNDLEIGRFVSKIDKLGRVELPVELMHEMGWCFGHQIALYFVYDRMVIFKLDKK